MRKNNIDSIGAFAGLLITFFLFPVHSVYAITVSPSASCNAGQVTALGGAPGICDIDVWFNTTNDSTTALKNPKVTGTSTPAPLWVGTGKSVYVWASYVFVRSIGVTGTSYLGPLTQTAILEEADDPGSDDEITRINGPVVPASTIPASQLNLYTGLIGPLVFSPAIADDSFGERDIVDLLSSPLEYLELDDETIEVDIGGENGTKGLLLGGTGGLSWGAQSVTWSITIIDKPANVPAGATEIKPQASAVPLPASAGLFIFGLVSLAGFAKNKRREI